MPLRSLEEMGFTETQAEHVRAVVLKFREGTTKHALSTFTALFVLGLNVTSMLKVLEKCPELYNVREAQLQQRIRNLRKLGFVEGEIKVSQYCGKGVITPVVSNMFFRQSSESGGPLPSNPDCAYKESWKDSCVPA